MENTNIEMSEKMRRRETMRGTALTLMGGVFWGLAGVFGKYSFEHKGMTAQWLVNVRLIIAGLILLTTVYMKQKKDTFRVWKNARHTIRMILYGVIGIAACQMTYYMAVDDSNAGIATVLQYTAPVMIMIYLSIRNRKLPEVSERVALILAFGGIILLATHGHLTELSISKTTLVLGLMSAVATVFYNLLPGQRLRSASVCETVEYHTAYYLGLADVSLYRCGYYCRNSTFFRILHGRSAPDRRIQSESVCICRAVDGNDRIRIFYGCGIFGDGFAWICRYYWCCSDIIFA